MRNFRKPFGVLACTILLAFTACQKEDAVMPGAAATTEFASTLYQLDNLDGLEAPAVTTDTETGAFAISSGERPTPEPHTLRYILRQLNLTERQRTAIKGYVEQHNTCLAEHRTQVQARHQDLVARANTLRQELVKAYREGRITKAELDEKLSVLRDRLKAQLNSDEQKQHRMRLMHQCRLELFKSIASVLDREQLAKWTRWRHSL